MSNTLVSKIYTNAGITKERILEAGKLLHIGCGDNKLPGAIGVDVLKLPAVDVVCDLDVVPWPFEDNSIDAFFAQNVVEHLADIPSVFGEIWRVGKNGARVVITVPYFRSTDAFTDPTHRHFFTAQSLDYFIEGTKLSQYAYVPYRFKKIGFWYGWPHENQQGVTRLLKQWMKKHSRLYDQFFSLLFPVKILVWELEIVK